MLSLTDRIAEHVPSLRELRLAQAAATLVIRTVLDAYRTGSRAAQRAVKARHGLSEERLKALAAESREQARATDRSKRLILEHIHELYRLGGSCKKFVRHLRRYPLEALHAAERRFRGAAQRSDIRDHARYFAAIVRNCADVVLAGRNAQERNREQFSKLEADARRMRNQQARDEADPGAWLLRGLNMLSSQWYRGALLGGGAGLGRAAIRGALRSLHETRGPRVLQDIATGVFQRFSLKAPDLL